MSKLESMLGICFQARETKEWLSAPSIFVVLGRIVCGISVFKFTSPRCRAGHRTLGSFLLGALEYFHLRHAICDGVSPPVESFPEVVPAPSSCHVLRKRGSAEFITTSSVRERNRKSKKKTIRSPPNCSARIFGGKNFDPYPCEISENGICCFTAGGCHRMLHFQAI
jgi:hypothetical protein